MLKKTICLLVPTFLVLFMLACDDFQEEDFSVEGLDKTASMMLNDSTLVPDTVLVKDITAYNAGWFGSAVYANASTIIDSLNNDTLLVQSGTDLFMLSLPASDTSYVVLSTALDKVVLYVTNFIVVRPVKSDGSVISPGSLNMKMELVFECPDLKYRAEFNNLDPICLLQIIKGEQFTGSTMKMVILGN